MLALPALENHLNKAVYVLVTTGLKAFAFVYEFVHLVIPLITSDSAFFRIVFNILDTILYFLPIALFESSPFVHP